MRQTIYIPSSGYVTIDDQFQYGSGILGDTINVVKDLIFSKPVKDLAIEGAKNFGTTLAKKTGEKAADKIADKMFKSNKSNKSNRSNESNKSVTKQNKDILKQIYGDGIFRGKGLRRL